MRLVTGFLVLLALWWLPVSAQTPGTPDELHVFVREGCPHCASAKAFLAALGPEDLRGVHVVLRDVSQDEQARSDLERLSQAVGAWPPGVPTFLFKGTVLVGFDDSEHTGRALLQLIQQDGARPAVRDQVETQLFGPLNVNRLGMPLFTLALGLLDGFNPCATWVLLFLLSLLVRLRDRRRMAVVAGTFVLASGAVYYAFMAAWLNFFVVLGLSSTLRVVLGTVALLIGLLNVKDFFAFGRGPSFSIPDSAKPGLYERMRRVMAAVLSEDDLRANLEGTGRLVAARLQKYLGALATIASAAPLLGLLGTVIGMIEIFGSQAGDGLGVVPGGGNPGQLAHGISIALYNTAFGLLIAIPALAGWRILRAVADQRQRECEECTRQLFKKLYPQSASSSS